jgi:hypothetical protein
MATGTPTLLSLSHLRMGLSLQLDLFVYPPSATYFIAHDFMHSIICPLSPALQSSTRFQRPNVIGISPVMVSHMRLAMPMLLNAAGLSRLLLVADRYNTTYLHALVPHFAINTNSTRAV